MEPNYIYSRPIRNNANIRIDVPQYVNLYVYRDHFEVSVTLHINEYAVNWFNRHFDIPSRQEFRLRYFTFSKKSQKTGRISHYVTVIRSYYDLNLVGYAVSGIARDDLIRLKKDIRRAKIDQLTDEINNIH